MINHFLNVFTFLLPLKPIHIYHLLCDLPPTLLSFEIWTSIHTAIFILWVFCQTHTYFLVLCTCCLFDLQSLPSRLCSLGPPSEHQFKFHVTFISALEFSGFALLLIQNHYHSSFISILVSAIVDYSYTVEYKLSKRQRCTPPLSHNLTLIGQDGHVCNPSTQDAETASL